MLQTISITISGKVQGVYFRQSTKDKGLELGLTGTVSNLPDGRVHVVATGSSEQLQELINWCHLGPPRAKVSGVSIENLPLQSFKHFAITR